MYLYISYSYIYHISCQHLVSYYIRIFPSSINTTDIIYFIYNAIYFICETVESGGGPIFKVFLALLKRCSEPFLIYIYGIQCDFMQKSCWKHSHFENCYIRYINLAPILRNHQKTTRSIAIYSKFLIGMVRENKIP